MRRSVLRVCIRGVLVAGACAAMTACDEKLSNVTGPTPDLTPTFSSIQADILGDTDASGRTACVGCHTNAGRSPAGGFNMAIDAYAAMVNVPSRQQPGAMLVAPGDPANSYLVRKLRGSPGINGLQMPLGGPPFLTEGQIQVIERWIQLGAQNN